MSQLYSKTSLAAALLLAPQLAIAQTAQSGAAQPATAQGQQQPGLQQLQQAEQSLRQAVQQMQSAQGPQQNQAAQGVRQALTQLQQAMQQLPAEQRGSQNAQRLGREVGEAQASLQGERPDMARARTQVDEVLVVIPIFRAELGAGAQIVVREGAPTVSVQQAQPIVTIVQPEPVITVIVPQPEIVVRQAQPQVTVQMPEPQVTVRMPEPQVRVIENQTQPQVQVTPGQAQVQVQRGEPQVRIERQGQPVIRFEQQGEAQARAEQPAQMAAQQAPSGTAAVAPGAASGVGMPLARAESIVGTKVVGANGRDSGEVENLLIDRSGQVRAAIIEWGGFLGLGQSRAVVPIDQLRFGAAGERVRMDLTREQLERLERFDRNRLADYGRDQGWGDNIRLYR